MSLKKYIFLSADNTTWTQIPDPDPGSYNIQPVKVEDILTTESGKTKKVIQRKDKRQINCTFTLTDIWMMKLAVWNNMNGFYIKFFDDISGKDTVAYVYTDGWNPQLIDGSTNHTAYQGIWTCPLNFVEF
jgi:hypothetical protein